MTCHTGSVSRPRTHVREPMREPLRKQMFGNLKGQHDERRVGVGVVLLFALAAIAFLLASTPREAGSRLISASHNSR
jgi:hypothetical protein